MIMQYFIFIFCICIFSPLDLQRINYMLCPTSLYKNFIHGYEWEVFIKMFSGEKMIKERKIKVRKQRGGKHGQKNKERINQKDNTLVYLEDSGPNIIAWVSI